MKARTISLDVIRCVAILCVIGVHSFGSSTGYCFPQSVIRTFSVLGVPLFLLLTGYLNSNITVYDFIKKKKWKTLIVNYVAYVILGSICFFVSHGILKSEINISNWIGSILDFSVTPYGWYMEMWIGLFLITPFYNIILKNLDKKGVLLLIATLLICCQLTQFINRNGLVIMPSFWTSLWPLSLYTIGYYIKTYPIKINKIYLCSFLAISLVFEYFINYIIGTGHNYIYWYGGHGGIAYLIISVALFLILYNREYKETSKSIKIMGGVARISFFMYLVSGAFDNPIYSIIKPLYFENQLQFMPYRIVVYIFVVILSFTVAYVYNYFHEWLKSKI